MADILRDYCKTSTICIIRYIGDSKKSYTERCLWVVVLLVASGQLVSYFLIDWTALRTGPLQVGVEDARLNVGNLDFPAVTVCPMDVINPQKLQKLIKRVIGPSVDEETAKRFSGTLKALTLVGFPSWSGGYNYIVSKNMTPFPIHNDDIIPFFRSVAHSVEEVIMNCYWMGTEFPCTDLVRLQPSEYGFCYSFNSFTSIRQPGDSDRNPPFFNEEGEFVGLRTNSEGRSNGLELFMWPNENLSMNDIIAHVVVNSPKTFPPILNMNPIRVRAKMVYHMEITVEVNNVDSSLYQMDRAVLPCSLDHLDTTVNCLMGCRHRHIWRHCQCVLYTHAILYNNVTARICGVRHLKCLADLEMSLDNIQMHSSLFEPFSNSTNGMECNCKPICSYMTYHSNLQLTPREADVYTFPYSVYLDVFYLSKWALGFVKRSKLTVSDLIGIGGTSGLYLGASFISLLEIIVMFFKIMYPHFTLNTKSKPAILKTQNHPSFVKK